MDPYLGSVLIKHKEYASVQTRSDMIGLLSSCGKVPSLRYVTPGPLPNNHSLDQVTPELFFIFVTLLIFDRTITKEYIHLGRSMLTYNLKFS